MKEFFSIIRSSQLFSGVSEEELTAMLSCLETRKESFPKDALLLRIGDTADAIGGYVNGESLTAIGERNEILTALEAFYRLEQERTQ